MKSKFDISDSSECRLWWRKEGFNPDGNILDGHLDMTLYEAGLARITGKVLY